MLNLVANGPSGYNLTNSLRFRASASAYLSRTPASTGSRQTFTYSFWTKRGTLGTLQRFIAASDNLTGDFIIDWTTSNTLEIYDNGPANVSLITTQVFRDPSAWYHIVIVYDTTNATTANRVRVYVNGTQVTAFGTATYPAQNTNSFNNQASIPARIGIWPSGSQYFDGYMAEFNFIDGQALTPSSFGSTNSTTGVWQPAKYTGTYGTNGFYLNFSSIATTSGSNTGLGKDYSGNGNYWNTNNISVTSGTTYDAMTDVPTLTSATVANYAVMNPLKTPITGTYSNANLTVSFGTSEFTPAQTTIYPTSGKWYWEAVWVSGSNARIGVQNTTVASTDFGSDTAGWRWENGGAIYNNATLITVSSYATGDVLGFCLDLDSGKLYVSKNGTWQNSAVPASGTGAVATNIPTNTPMSPAGSTGYLPTVITWNFGQRPFSYTPPTGFVALNTYNLPTSTIVQGNKYMDATLYTGNNTTNNIVNAGGFKPDLVWVKSRSAAYSNTLINSVMGLGSALFSDTTQAVVATSEYTSFNSNGFSLTTSGSTASNVNGATYVAWQWQAGQGSTSSGTGTGGITSVTQSVNATAGFSIVTYTGSGANGTVTHGLGVAPKWVIVKRRDSTSDWPVWNPTSFAVSSANVLFLNATNANFSGATNFNSTAPTPTVFSVGTNPATNASSGTYVAYCWAEIAGFSKFTSYTGNGSADGVFVYLGFRPKYVLTKRTDTTSDWIIYDTSRNTYNVSDLRLYPNASTAETQAGGMDLLSNGFKLRDTGPSQNASGGTYIVAAFAENPFKNSLAR